MAVSRLALGRKRRKMAAGSLAGKMAGKMVGKMGMRGTVRSCDVAGRYYDGKID